VRQAQGWSAKKRSAEVGIVGNYKGSQVREVLLTLEEWEALKKRRRPNESPQEEVYEEVE
jgi:hypothetical protein